MDIVLYRHNINQNYCLLKDAVINYYELTFLIKGKITYYSNGKKIEIQGGDVICLTPKTLRRREKLSNCDYVSFNFVSDEPVSLPLVLNSAIDNTVKSILSACDDISNGNYYCNDERLICLLSCLIKHLKYKVDISDTNPLVIKIKNYIKNNLQNKIMLKDIADHVNYTGIYLAAVFKKETGTSIIEYLIEQRINTAKTFLIENVLPLKEIAEKSGFPDCNYFSRAFKKYTGYPPIQYKKNYYK